MSVIDDIIYELKAIIESLCGKKTVKSWLESVSDSADTLIEKIEDRDDAVFDSGELHIVVNEQVVNAIMKLKFLDASGGSVDYESNREFERKKFVSKEVENNFPIGKTIVYPIEKRK